jgi:hypothetical protein
MLTSQRYQFGTLSYTIISSWKRFHCQSLRDSTGIMAISRYCRNAQLTPELQYATIVSMKNATHRVIGDIAAVRTGHAFRGKVELVADGNVSIIRPHDITAVGEIKVDRTTPALVKVKSPRPLADGDILLVTRSRFAAAVFDADLPSPTIVSSAILVITISDALVLPRYLAAYFNSPHGQRLALRNRAKTTISFLSAQMLASMEIPIPSLEQQEQIIALDRMNHDFARLSVRKLELQRHLLTHQLSQFEPHPIEDKA